MYEMSVFFCCIEKFFRLLRLNLSFSAYRVRVERVVIAY